MKRPSGFNWLEVEWCDVCHEDTMRHIVIISLYPVTDCSFVLTQLLILDGSRNEKHLQWNLKLVKDEVLVFLTLITA
jgi:hypothetical protein